MQMVAGGQNTKGDAGVGVPVVPRMRAVRGQRQAGRGARGWPRGKVSTTVDQGAAAHLCGRV